MRKSIETHTLFVLQGYHFTIWLSHGTAVANTTANHAIATLAALHHDYP